MPEFPAEIRDFADAFVELQMARQQADYALDTAAYRTSDVLGYVVSAEPSAGEREGPAPRMKEQAISPFERAAVEARRAFAAHVLFRQRSP